MPSSASNKPRHRPQPKKARNPTKSPKLTPSKTKLRSLDDIIPVPTAIGTIVKPHGLRGGLLISLRDQRLQPHITPGRWIFIAHAQKPVPYRVKGIRWTPTGGLMALEEIRTVEEAQPLKGKPLLWPRAWIQQYVPELIFPEWLVGMSVIINQTHAGVVEDVTELPTQWLLHVRIDEKVYPIPFLPEQDKKIGEAPLEVTLPPGWQLR